MSHFFVDLLAGAPTKLPQMMAFGAIWTVSIFPVIYAKLS